MKKKKKKKLKKIIKVLFFVVVGLLLICVLINVSYKDKEIIVIESITEGCYDLNIFDSALCLQKNVKSFYNYNISNEGKDLTFEELKQYGGVCTDYSSLYYNAGEELGFYVEEVLINKDENIGHAFTVISNVDGWCFLSGKNAGCLKF